MRTIILAMLCTVAAFGQAFRVDPTPASTTSGSAPPGAYAPLLAVPGAVVGLCGDAGCAGSATSYTSAAGATPCPSNAPVVPRGTAVCASSTDSQGNFGFWLLPGNYWYTLTYNSSTYGPFPISAGGSGGGGGGGSPALPAGSVQFNNSGAFGGFGTWNATTQLLTIPGIGGTPVVHITSGYVESDGGFDSLTATNYNSIQSGNGGVYALSGTFLNYINGGNYTAALTTGPTMTTGDAPQPGALSWSKAGGCEAVYNGTGWGCLSGGGGGANTALSNLAAVSINTALLFQGGADLGSSANPPRNLYLYGSGTYGTGYVELTGSPSAARTWTFPNVSGTFAGTSGALTSGDCAQFNSSGLIVDSGAPCGTGGGGGITSINSQTGPAFTLTGTANEVIITTTTNTATFTLPQAIATTSNVTFYTLTANGPTGTAINIPNGGITTSGLTISTTNGIGVASNLSPITTGVYNLGVGTNVWGTLYTNFISLGSSSSTIVPYSSHTGTLGTSSRVFNNVYSDDVTVGAGGNGGQLTVGTPTALVGNITVSNNGSGPDLYDGYSASSLVYKVDDVGNATVSSLIVGGTVSANGSTGISGYVLTSQGPSSPAIWSAAGSSCGFRGQTANLGQYGSGQRVAGSVYTNSGSCTLFVEISVFPSTTTGTFGCYVGATNPPTQLIVAQNVPTGIETYASYMVPPGYAYTCNVSGGAILPYWTEVQ